MLAHEGLQVWRPPDLGNLEVHCGRSSRKYWPRHLDETFEIVAIRGGVGGMHYRGTRHTASAAFLTVIQPGEVHSGGALGEAAFSFVGLHADPALLRDAAAEVAKRENGAPFFPSPVVRDECLNALVLDLVRSTEGSAPRLEQESLLLSLLAQLVLRHAGDGAALRPLGRERGSVRRAREYLEDRYAENVSLEHLASVSNLSAFHLCRVFREEVGLPPHAYQIQVRVWRAKALLTKGLPAERAAIEAGFFDPSHFTRHFKKLVGVTPGLYAEALRRK